MTIQTRRPTGNSATNNFTPVGDTNNFECVDEVSPDDDTTYCQRSDSNATQLFTYSDFAIDSSAIAKIILTNRAREISGDSVSNKAKLKVNGTEYSGAVQALTDSYVNYVDEYLVNPDTGSAWVEADVEGSGSNPIEEFGTRLQNLSGGEEGRLTQALAQVDYTESGGGTLTISVADCVEQKETLI